MNRKTTDDAAPCPDCGYYNASDAAGCYDCGKLYVERPELDLGAWIPPAGTAVRFVIGLVMVFSVDTFSSALSRALIGAAGDDVGPNDDFAAGLVSLTGVMSNFMKFVVVFILAVYVTAFISYVALFPVRRRRFNRRYTDAPVGVLANEERAADRLYEESVDSAEKVCAALADNTLAPDERTALESAVARLKERQALAAGAVTEIGFRRWQNRAVAALSEVARGGEAKGERVRERLDRLAAEGGELRAAADDAPAGASRRMGEPLDALLVALERGRDVLRRRRVTQLVAEAAGGDTSFADHEPDAGVEFQAESYRQLMNLVEREAAREQEFEFARAAALEELKGAGGDARERRRAA